VASCGDNLFLHRHDEAGDTYAGGSTSCSRRAKPVTQSYVKKILGNRWYICGNVEDRLDVRSKEEAGNRYSEKCNELRVGVGVSRDLSFFRLRHKPNS